jgi:hypothetical protein
MTHSVPGPSLRSKANPFEDLGKSRLKEFSLRTSVTKNIPFPSCGHVEISMAEAVTGGASGG